MLLSGSVVLCGLRGLRLEIRRLVRLRLRLVGDLGNRVLGHVSLLSVPGDFPGTVSPGPGEGTRGLFND